jgi:iron complex transport system substrate-binding protein
MILQLCARLLALGSLLGSLVGCGMTAPVATPTTIVGATRIAAVAGTPTVPPAREGAAPMTDMAGRPITLTGIPTRIVSLAPSNTEILYALDLGRQVVAVDMFSDFPAAVATLPKVGGSAGKFNYEQIVALKPDLVLAADNTPPDAVQKFTDLKLPVVVASVTRTTFDGILADITFVGQITGRANQAGKVTTAMRQQRDAIAARVRGAPRPRVYWELDLSDPSKPYSVGPDTFVNDLINLAGGVNVFAGSESPYPQISAEQVVAANPQVSILSDAASGIPVDSVGQRAGWAGIAAVRTKRVYPIDDNLVSRAGPRVVEGLATAARLIHPELFK